MRDPTSSWSPSELEAFTRLARFHHWKRLSSRGVVPSLGVSEATLPRALVTKSLFVLRPWSVPGQTLRFSRRFSSAETRISPDHLLQSYTPLQSITGRARQALQPRPGRSHGVRSPSAPAAVWSPLTPGLPHPVRCAFRLSQPPSALLLQTPPGLISCR